MVLGNIDLHRTRSNTYNNIKYLDLDKSLFVESIDMIIENNRSINDMLKDIHSKVVLSESKDITFLNEFSIKDLIGNIIGFFVETINKIFAKFKNIFSKVTFSNKTLDKYETRLKNLKGEFTCTFDRYIYTCTDPSIPSINLEVQFEVIFSDLLKDLEELKDLKTKSERSAKLDVMQAKINQDVGAINGMPYYDSVRASSLKKNYNFISEKEYSTELFNTFRNGGEYSNIKVDANELTIVFDRYKNNKKILKDVERLKADTISSAKKVENKINNISLDKCNNYYKPYDTDEETKFSKIISLKVGQVNKVCNIYILAFSAKCDAIKESFKQDRKLLMEAIQYINESEEVL